jgi:uncharacterized repeat protein (TIGR01451 family)
MRLRQAERRGDVRWLAAPCSAAAVLGLLVAAAAAGRSVPAFAYLPALPALEQRDLSIGSIHVPNLRREFLVAALGEEGLANIVGPSRTHTSSRAATGRVTAAPAPTPAPTREEPYIGDTGSWRLESTMTADRQTVEPGGTIRYSVITRNTGRAAFRGEFMITSHVPFGTTDARPSPCGPAGVDPDPDHPCVNPMAPVPGPPTNDVHTVAHGEGYVGDAALEPDESHVFTFAVRVDRSTQPGTRIANHAHFDVTGDSEDPETTFEVVVMVT